MADSPDSGRTTEGTRIETEPEEDDRRTVDLTGSKLLAGLVSLIGAWIAVSPYVYGDLAGGTQLDAAGWNNVIVGAAIFLVAGYNFYRMSKDMNVSEAASGLTLLLGLWAIVSAIAVFDMGTAGLFWSTVVSGLIAASIGAYNAYKGRQARDIGTAVRT